MAPSAQLSPVCHSYLATLSLGAVAVNLNPLYTADELKLIVETTDMTTLITFDMVLPIVRPLIEDAKIPRIVVTKVTDFIDGLVSALPQISNSTKDGTTSHHSSKTAQTQRSLGFR